MNKVILMGRLTRDPDIRYTTGESQTCVARFTLAVSRRQQGSQEAADYISCAAFGKRAEFAEKYLRKGMKVLVSGEIRTGSYPDRDGRKIYTTDVIVNDYEFAESKGAGRSGQIPESDNDGFMNIDGADEGLPFA